MPVKRPEGRPNEFIFLFHNSLSVALYKLWLSDARARARSFPALRLAEKMFWAAGSAGRRLTWTKTSVCVCTSVENTVFRRVNRERYNWITEHQPLHLKYLSTILICHPQSVSAKKLVPQIISPTVLASQHYISATFGRLSPPPTKPSDRIKRVLYQTSVSCCFHWYHETFSTRKHVGFFLLEKWLTKTFITQKTKKPLSFSRLHSIRRLRQHINKAGSDLGRVYWPWKICYIHLVVIERRHYYDYRWVE